MHRRHWIGGMAGSLLALQFANRHLMSQEANHEKDVPWLREVKTVPNRLPEEDKELGELIRKHDLLRSSYGTNINTGKEWEYKRQVVKKWWCDFLGIEPDAPRGIVDYEVLEEKVVDENLIRKLIRYETHPGWPVEAYLLFPKNLKEKARAAVVFHPTVEPSIEEPAGVGSNGLVAEGPRALALHLARKGFVTISPRNFLWPTNHGIQAKEQAKKWLEFSRKLSATKSLQHSMIGMGKMVYDGLVAVDILQSLPMVASERISVLGHSLGAKEAMYAVAFDDRIRACAASEGGIGIRFSNWDAAWYLGEKVKSPDFAHEHHEVLAIAAPKPLLIVAGESADGDRGWQLLTEAQKVYQLRSPTVRLGQFNHRQDHPLNEIGSQRMLEWIDCYG